MRHLALVLALSLAPALACSSSAERGKAALNLGPRDAGTRAAATRGDLIEVSLSSPRGVAPEYRHSWAATPQVEGAALRLVSYRQQDPGDDVDGGSFRYIYRFEAVSAGEATIAIDIAERGEEAPEGPWTATITVQE